ncbi:MAG: DUF4255 domain-containing protein [Actinomycetota bacterium]|nr:DUF4255 domain-containing protein [Actinomycetota bacterium]
MADFRAIAAAGKTIERVLNACFAAEQPVRNKVTKAVVVQTEDFDRTTGESAIPTYAVSIFLYRVEVNRVMRAAWAGVGSFDGQAHLPVDLHFLLTAWAENAEHEHQILGKAIQCLDSFPSMSGPVLYPSAGWADTESVQLMIEDVALEPLMRTFDSLDADFRLSIPYMARIVRVDGREIEPPAPATTVVAGIAPGVP